MVRDKEVRGVTEGLPKDVDHLKDAGHPKEWAAKGVKADKEAEEEINKANFRNDIVSNSSIYGFSVKAP